MQYSPPRSPGTLRGCVVCDQTGSLSLPPSPVPGYCSNMNDYHTQHYLTARIRLVNIDIGDGDHPQECLSDQETDLEEEIKNSIAGAAGKDWPEV